MSLYEYYLEHVEVRVEESKARGEVYYYIQGRVRGRNDVITAIVTPDWANLLETADRLRIKDRDAWDALMDRVAEQVDLINGMLAL